MTRDHFPNRAPLDHAPRDFDLTPALPDPPRSDFCPRLLIACLLAAGFGGVWLGWPEGYAPPPLLLLLGAAIVLAIVLAALVVLARAAQLRGQAGGE